MKKLIVIAVSLALLCTVLSGCDNVDRRVKINAENFPDDNFRQYLLSTDYGADAILTKKEWLGVEEMDVSYRNISDLTGINYFHCLKKLVCDGNQLEELDLKILKLEWLSCNHNQLSELEPFGALAQGLRHLECADNKIMQLDFEFVKYLEFLDCHDNQLTELDLSHCGELRTLICYGNNITDVTNLNISHNPYLETYQSDLVSSISDNDADINNTTSKSDIKADTWYTQASNTNVQWQNAEVTNVVPMSQGQAFMVTYYPVCKSCHVCGPTIQMTGVSADSPVTDTYYCQSCGVITYCLFEVAY